MFGKKQPERNPIIDQYDRRWWALNNASDIVKAWAQAVKWYGLPLDVFIKDTPEHRAAKQDVQEAQLTLRIAMGSYDTERKEFMDWVKRHFDELPQNYQDYSMPDAAIDVVRYALADIQKNGYFYFKNVKKN